MPTRFFVSAFVPDGSVPPPCTTVIDAAREYPELRGLDAPPELARFVRAYVEGRPERLLAEAG